MTINPKKLPITDAVITDTLPTGTENAILVSGKKGSVSGTIERDSRKITFGDVTITWEERTSTSSDGQSKVVFTFTDSSGKSVTINDCFELIFTTEVMEAHRRTAFKSNGDTSLLNTAQLDGTIGDEAIKGAIAIATNKFPPQPLLKTGTYTPVPRNGSANLEYATYDKDGNQNTEKTKVAAAFVDWTVYINRTNADYTGVEISDQLKDIFELVPTTMVVSTVELDAKGNQTVDGETIIYENPNPNDPKPKDSMLPLNSFTLNERGFSFEIPETYKTDTIKLKFTTILVDDAAKVLMTNQICAKGNGWEDETGNINADQAEDFRLESYANAEGMIFLQIKKKSSKPNDGDPVYLEGAEFTLQEMKQKDGESDSTQLTNWENNTDEVPKVKETNAKGKVAFMFLKPDTLYHVEETKSPVGYVQAPKSWYVVILEKSDISDFPRAAQGVTDGDGDLCDVTIQTEATYITEEIENTPGTSVDAPNQLVIKKTGQNEQLLSGVKFTLSHKGNKWDSITDTNGNAFFSNMDPISNVSGQYYTLTETAPTGYEGISTYRVYVTVKEAEGKTTYTVTMKSSDGKNDIPSEMEGQYTITNTPIKQSGSFTKVNQNGDSLTSPQVTFEVFRRGDGGTNIGTAESPSYTVDMTPPGTEYMPYLPLKSVNTSEKGIVELENLYYGDYKLVEVPESGSPNAQFIEKLADPVFLQVREDGMYAQDASKAYTINLKNPGNLKVVNKLKAGQIQVKKVAGDAVGNSGHTITKPMEGVTFVIGKAGEVSPFLTLETNANGNFTRNEDGSYTDAITGERKSLLPGDYTLKEIEAPAGFKTCTKVIDFSVTLENWNQVQYASFDGKDAGMIVDPSGVIPEFYNLPDRGTLSLVKQDETSSHNLDGAVFLAYADEAGTIPVAFVAQPKSGKPYGITGGQHLEALKKQFPGITLVTSQKGMASASGNDNDGYGLLCGNYYLKEIRAPYGYQLSSDTYRVTVNTGENSITIGNKLGNAGFAIYKTMEILNEDLTPSAQKAVGKDFVFLIMGNTQAGGGSQPIQKLESLRIDGRTLASANNAQAVAQGIQVTTGADGKVELSGIPVGTYIIKEIGGPDFAHYVSLPERTVTISQSEKQDKLEVSEAVVSFHNQQKRRDLSGIKKDQDGEVLAGAVFGLYAADGAIRYRTAVSGSDGIFTFTSIPTSSYVVKEIEAPEGYLLNPANTWQVTVGTESTAPVSMGLDIINVLIRGNIAGRKTDTFDKALPGATMGLFPADTTSFIQGNLFQGRTAISDAGGQFIFEQVPYGTYRVAELNAPNGYILNRTLSYLVTITEDGQTVNTGLRRENGKEEGTQPEAITIINKKNSGGNGGGDTTLPTTPTSPGTPEAGPGVPPTTPVIPPTIPFDPENPVVDIPGNPPRVEIRDPNNNVIYDGQGSGINIGGWGPGEYQIFTFDDADVPLGSMIFIIDDAGIPLASLPKTGDRSIPYAILAIIMLGALGGIGGILYKRKREQETK